MNGLVNGSPVKPPLSARSRLMLGALGSAIAMGIAIISRENLVQDLQVIGGGGLVFTAFAIKILVLVAVGAGVSYLHDDETLLLRAAMIGATAPALFNSYAANQVQKMTAQVEMHFISSAHAQNLNQPASAPSFRIDGLSAIFQDKAKFTELTKAAPEFCIQREAATSQVWRGFNGAPDSRIWAFYPIPKNENPNEILELFKSSFSANENSKIETARIGETPVLVLANGLEQSSIPASLSKILRERQLYGSATFTGPTAKSNQPETTDPELFISARMQGFRAYTSAVQSERGAAPSLGLLNLMVLDPAAATKAIFQGDLRVCK